MPACCPTCESPIVRQPPLTMDRVQDEKRHSSHDDTFNPIFPSLPNVSEDSGPRNYMDARDAPSPFLRKTADTSSEEALKQIRTANTISISPGTPRSLDPPWQPQQALLTTSTELFEKLYLTPQTKVKGDLRGTFANPTPVALIGFLLSCTPLACALMGWRGAGGGGIAYLGTYYSFVCIAATLS